MANPSGAIVIWLKANKQINRGPEYGKVQIGVHVGSWRHPVSVYLIGLVDTCDLRIGAAILWLLSPSYNRFAGRTRLVPGSEVDRRTPRPAKFGDPRFCKPRVRRA